MDANTSNKYRERKNFNFILFIINYVVIYANESYVA